MPLYLTAAHSSRFSTSGTGHRSSSSLLSSHTQSKPVTKRKSSQDISRDDQSQLDQDKLDATGKIVSVITVSAATDVVSAIQYVTSSMFCEIPERAGMNSTRTTQVLNFQQNMPPLVSLAHVHALISASSKTERQIAALINAGRIRKLRISGRGNDVSGYADILINTLDLQSLLRRSALPPETIADFMQVLQQHPRSPVLSNAMLSPQQIACLSQAGFLVSSSLSGSHNLTFSGASHVAIPSISRAASGSSDAVGGDAAFEKLGGIGSAKRSDSTTSQSGSPSGPSPSYVKDRGDGLSISVPNIGPYLRLLHSGRTHLVDLLKKFKYREAPLYLLRERWDGNVDSSNNPASAAKRARGEFGPVLAAKTKKWKDLYGLSFDWTLEECLGAGMVELFETRSVGLGVRVLT